MLIKREVLEAIKAGKIDIQFRRWKRRTVKPGGTLKTRVGVMRIGEIDRISADEVTLADARRAGFADLDAFHRWLDTMKPGELDRIEISYLGADPRIEMREKQSLEDQELAEANARLDAMDARAGGEAWTTAILGLIAQNPGRLASELAAEAGMDKPPFKARVRRLKELGLTESLEVGYRLSPRGETVLASRRT